MEAEPLQEKLYVFALAVPDGALPLPPKPDALPAGPRMPAASVVCAACCTSSASVPEYRMLPAKAEILSVPPVAAMARMLALPVPPAPVLTVINTAEPLVLVVEIVLPNAA